jgi:sterol desaturase/sphingolipid hydroxylase (fatty acid hydroxylase superfamily)
MAFKQEFFNFLKDEKARYYKKGLVGNFIGISFFIFYFYIIPAIILPAIWPEDHESPHILYISTSIGSHEVTFFLGNLLLMGIYKLEHPFFEKDKNFDQQWPWKENPKEWYSTLKRTLGYICFNHYIMTPILVIPNIIYKNCPYMFRNDELPTVQVYILHFLFFILCEDISFYWTHRLLHHNSIYKYVHRLHHEYKVPIGLASQHTHPIEFLFSNALTSNLGPLLLQKHTHLSTVVMWIILRTLGTISGHCGYSFFWDPLDMLPFSTTSEHHNYHHLNFKGNYVSYFIFWDLIGKTMNPAYLKTIRASNSKNFNIKYISDARIKED